MKIKSTFDRDIEASKTIEALEMLQSMQRVTPEMLKAHIKTPILSEDAKSRILEELFYYYDKFKKNMEEIIWCEFDKVNIFAANEDCFDDAYHTCIVDMTDDVMKEWFNQFPGLLAWYHFLLQMISKNERYNREISDAERENFLNERWYLNNENTCK